MWIVETMEEDFNEIINDRWTRFDPENVDQIALLRLYAETREHILETKIKHAPTHFFTNRCKDYNVEPQIEPPFNWERDLEDLMDEFPDPTILDDIIFDTNELQTVPWQQDEMDHPPPPSTPT